jgi:hypothetical protein
MAMSVDMLVSVQNRDANDLLKASVLAWGRTRNAMNGYSRNPWWMMTRAYLRSRMPLLLLQLLVLMALITIFGDRPSLKWLLASLVALTYLTFGLIDFLRQRHARRKQLRRD